MNIAAPVDKYQAVEKLLEDALQHDKEKGVFRCRRDIFTGEYAAKRRKTWAVLMHRPQAISPTDTYAKQMLAQPASLSQLSLYSGLTS